MVRWKQWGATLVLTIPVIVALPGFPNKTPGAILVPLLIAAVIVQASAWGYRRWQKR